MTRVVACESLEPGSVSIVWSNGERTTYRCDTAAHRVTVTDEAGRPCFAFGSRGAHPGQFESPMDLAFVAPEFDGEDLPTHLAAALWLAVADYGNRRVQIFELDGCLVGSVDDIEEAALGHPCRLRWRAPILDVETTDGAHGRIHLGAALLFASEPLGMPLAMRGPHGGSHERHH